MIKRSVITNLNNSFSRTEFEKSIKSFIASHEVHEGAKIGKDRIHIISVSPISNGESTFYNVMWELDPLFLY